MQKQEEKQAATLLPLIVEEAVVVALDLLVNQVILVEHLETLLLQVKEMLVALLSLAIMFQALVVEVKEQQVQM
jgi:hypothetical protein